MTISLRADPSGNFGSILINGTEAIRVNPNGIPAMSIGFTPSGNIAANNVQAALQEVDTETQAGLATKVSKSGDTMTGTLNFNITGGTDWKAGAVKNFSLLCQTQSGEAIDSLQTALGLFYNPTQVWAGPRIDFYRGNSAENGRMALRGSAIEGYADIMLKGSPGNNSNAVQFWHGSGTGRAAFILGQIYPGQHHSFLCTVGDTQTFDLRSTGVGYAPGGWQTGSDRKLKDNITPISDALYKLGQISGNTFTRNDLNDAEMAGVIAQEVQVVLPEAVTSLNEQHLAVDYNGVTALLVEAVKELSTKLDAAVAEIAALKAAK